MKSEQQGGIKNNINTIKERINNACTRYQRKPDHITLLAVSKRWPISDIRTAWQQGMRCFGESYVKEAIDKMHQLHDLGIEWHFIGPLQSNKTRLIAEHFDWVHSLCSIKHARRIHEQRPQHLAPIQACLQINISQESSKSGVAPDQALALAQEIHSLKNIRLRGLMTLPAACDDIEQQRQAFKTLQQLQTQLNRHNLMLDSLSMGMSNDMEAAIAEGSTMVRIGSAIFGTRK
ncbi:MAG: YggS family pyridoxal phosphate-dependent enzyme [Gammaproteobacteria bacterium]|nr:YggS family pyridoxal phosphate-dependent enzyme [Gammaproteobacteria bacterium]